MNYREIVAKVMRMSMAKALIVIDEDVWKTSPGIEGALQHENFRTISIPQGLKDEDIKHLYLNRSRYFLTNNLKDFEKDVARNEYKIISTKNLSYKGAAKLAKLISRVMAIFKIRSKTGGLIVKLSDNLNKTRIEER